MVTAGRLLFSATEAIRERGDVLRAQLQAADAVALLLDGELAAEDPGTPERDAVRRYYGKFLHVDDRTIPLAAFAYVQRLWPLFECLSSKPGGLRVLDAGCGYGTESYLMALLGHDVTGVELVPERVGVARSRERYFRTASSFPLAIRFTAANILSHLRAGDVYDVIWAMEAISHIHPPVDFLRLARTRLVAGGYLVVSDPNRANPLALWRSVAIRGSLRHRTHEKFDDPETGNPVPYGQEHITSTARIVSVLEAAGFVVKRAAVSGFIGTTVLPRCVVRQPLAAAVLRRAGLAAAQVPLIQRLGTVYTVVARNETSR